MVLERTETKQRSEGHTHTHVLEEVTNQTNVYVHVHVQHSMVQNLVGFNEESQMKNVNIYTARDCDWVAKTASVATSTRQEYSSTVSTHSS